VTLCLLIAAEGTAQTVQKPLNLKVPAALFAPAPAMITLAPKTAAQVAPATRKRSPAKIVAGALVGGAAGLFAGGYLGGAIEGDSCHCDDQGLQGALIGAPIGLAVGAVLGGFFLF